jgi:hypothetical protein
MTGIFLRTLLLHRIRYLQAVVMVVVVIINAMVMTTILLQTHITFRLTFFCTHLFRPLHMFAIIRHTCPVTLSIGVSPVDSH